MGELGKKIVAVDFDGTLVDYNGWNGHHHIGDLKEDENPRHNLQRLREEGMVIMIYTCRGKTEPVREFLEENDIPFDHINENPYQPEGVADCKLFAWRYIDDRNANFEGLAAAVDSILGGDDDD